MRGKLRGGLAVALVLAAAVACNALTGAGDLGTGGCDDCDAGAAAVDAATPDSPGVTADAGDATTSDSGFDAAALPSFCTGLVLYAPLENNYATSQGAGPAPPLPSTATFAPGKFGGGAALNGVNGALYYANGMSPLGVPYPKEEGTIALWFKPLWTWPSAVDRVFAKPVSDTTNNNNTAGPSFRLESAAPSMIGFINPNAVDAGTVRASSPVLAATPYWNATGFNHMVGTWKHTAPTLTFTLNGATGDPSITHIEITDAWDNAATVNFTRISSDVVPPDGVFDDVAMWSRALSLAEIKDLYGANRSIGDVCHLPGAK